jgi:hypothetical protein
MVFEVGMVRVACLCRKLHQKLEPLLCGLQPREVYLLGCVVGNAEKKAAMQASGELA